MTPMASGADNYIRNGDDTDFGVYLFPSNGATRIVLE